MNDQPFGLGAHPSPIDERDQHFKDSELTYAFPFPTVYTTQWPSLLPENVKHQHSIGICTSSLTYEVELLYWRKTGTYVKLSFAFLYLITKKYIDKNTDEGSSLRSALKAAQKYGVCTEATFPSKTNVSYEDFIKQEIPQAAMDEALNYRIGAYRPIPIEPSLMAGAIYKYGALYGRVEIDSNWWTPTWFKKDIDPLRPPKAAKSGHAVNFFGYDCSGDKVPTRLLNTWGEGWDDVGTGTLVYEDYMPHLTELWAVTLDPIVAEPVDNSPVVSEQVWRWVTALLRRIWQGKV